MVENLQRENLNPIEEARAYESLVEKGFTHAEIADKMGKSRPYISNSIRLLSLPEQILSEVENGKPDPDIFIEALNQAGYKKEEALILEDSYNGYKAAKASGMDYIIIHDSSFEKDFDADCEASNLNEVINIIGE